MAYLKGSIYSEALQMRSGLVIVTPKNVADLREKPPKAVYLLHGLSDNCDDWAQNAQLPLLADAYRLIFLVPEVQRSFYTDMAYGPAYFTYIADELPRLCQSLLPLTGKREDTYVMGLSMGGYGALKCALSRPERFAGCAAFSAACILEDCVEFAQGQVMQEMRSVFGLNSELLPQNDLRFLAKECEKKPQKPEIFMTCGTEDFIHEQSVKFREFMKGVDIPFTYQEWPGVHEWYLWNKSLHLACRHFFPRVTPEDYCNIV